jgi:type I restriction enzyme, S subunit
MKAKKYRIGEICRMVKGISPTLKTEPGPYPLVVTAEFRRTADSWQLEGPAVCIPLVSSTGHGDAALHRVHYQEGKFALANLLVALLPNDLSVCDAQYLYHLLMTQKDELLVPLMQGTANVSLKEQDIAGVEIPLPPLPEQRRVVARIEELAARIHEARTLRRQAAEETAVLLPSGMAEIFRRLGEKHPSKKLQTLCDVVRGGSPRPAGSPTYYGGNIPFLKVGDLTKDDGMYVYEASATVNELGCEQSRYIEADTVSNLRQSRRLERG